MTDTIDIAAEAAPVASRAEVIARLRQNEEVIRRFGATALYLFGSAAPDEMTDKSDVDLFIDYDPNGDLDQDIENFVRGLDYDAYVQRRIVKRGVERCVDIISEASRTYTIVNSAALSTNSMARYSWRRKHSAPRLSESC